MDDRQFEIAETTLLESKAILLMRYGTGNRHRMRVLERLRDLYVATKQAESAERYRQLLAGES